MKKKTVKRPQYYTFVSASDDKSELIQFKTLSSLKTYAIENNLKTDILVTAVYSNKKKRHLKPHEFLFKNKYYDVSKSNDGTGFYYKYEWINKGPFDVDKVQPKKPVEIPPIEAKLPTFWQKLKKIFKF